MSQAPIKVGTILYDENYKKIFPVAEGYKRIEVMMKSTTWGELVPYVLSDNNGNIMENIWQFSKIYEVVPKTTQRYSRFNNTVIWDYPQETHVINGEITEEYWVWRQRGFTNPYPVGYSKKNRASCLYSITDNGQKCDYIEARKQIYLPTYTRIVKKQDRFQKLKTMLNKGIKLLIVEVDGPKQNSLQYYKDTYNVDDNFIVNNTIDVTRENMNIMINDPKHAFGHGYGFA